MIVNREEFIKIMNSDVDINWEQTARDNISIIFKLYDKLDKIEEAITTCLTFHTCQKCKFYKECEMSLEEFILEIIRGAEDE